MYKNNFQMSFEDFFLPFEGHLSESNRWIRLSKIIPWKSFEKTYCKQFKSKQGNPAKSARMALGCLIIKERLRCSDEETVQQIIENPYLQCFLGFKSYQTKPPLEASTLVHFRKRISPEMIASINEQVIATIQEAESNLLTSPSVTEKKRTKLSKDHEDASTDSFSTETENTEGQESSLNKDLCSNEKTSQNQGKLLVDATCAPADIAYPTDLHLLNESREKTEKIIDILYFPLSKTIKKPRTYRRKARKEYLGVAKKKKASSSTIHHTIGQQLRYVRRNLKSIDDLIVKGADLSHLSKKNYRDLLVISEVYRQQEEMHRTQVHSIEGRIVGISQPHVRPIVRGKASAKTEFGAKLSASLTGGFFFLDKVSWEAFNEAKDLIEQIKSYKKRTGFYPQSVHADKIYRTRENRKFCKEHSIRLSGHPLGRPPLNSKKNKEEKKQVRQDEVDRIPIEGKFGQAKRRFSLSRIMAKTAQTSLSTISMIFLVINLEKWIQSIFYFLFFMTTQWNKVIFSSQKRSYSPNFIKNRKSRNCFTLKFGVGSPEKKLIPLGFY